MKPSTRLTPNVAPPTVRGMTAATPSARAATLPSTAYNDLSKSFFASIVAPSTTRSSVSELPPGVRKVAAAETSSTSGPRNRVVRKILVKKLVKPASSNINNNDSVEDNGDWSDLSEGALKRKTVKELSDYLESRGARTKGSDGKPLKKDELVEMAQKLVLSR